ncbi:PaaI family thioesterase [Trichloromonas sp.]|uniref:PaaI family thioesterase n=1 Tax=Trichloromonas sp. TaxID=3069249 RepID=UPI002A428EA3|nr:hotdog domain-containing protein [Trichloromonas sp.]
MARPEMVADDRGLVHGGFTFGLADYAAMLAVNDPHVVLGAAEVKFLAPVTLGETMLAKAEVIGESGKKRQVRCTVSTDRPVFEGSFTCFVLPGHVLDC